MPAFRTGEAARAIGVHENTVRFYEKAGLITPPARTKSGYRIYTGLQIE